MKLNKPMLHNSHLLRKGKWWCASFLEKKTLNGFSSKTPKTTMEVGIIQVKRL